MKIILGLLILLEAVVGEEKWFDSLKGVQVDNYEYFKALMS